MAEELDDALEREVDLNEALRGSIEETLREHADTPDEHGVLIAWVLVADVATVDGERYMRLLADPTTPAWHKIGMLEFSRMLVGDVSMLDEPDDE